jgi:2-oxoglutarate dehydrogenase E2 component (dihydrolipoamide succinyltransferase)
MSIFEIKMPKLGESITEGTIIAWRVKPGDLVQEDDVLFEVNTAKVSAEIPSPVAGRVTEVLANEGDTIAIGVTVARIDLSGEAASTPAAPASTPAASAPASTPAPVADTASAPQQEPTRQSAPKSAAEGRWYSPVVLRLAQEAKIEQAELDTIQGTGFEGRLSKRDITRYIEQKKQQQTTATPAATQKAASPAQLITPSTSIPATAAPAAVTADTGEVEVKEMDYVRRLIADHMTMSKQVSPHVTSVIEADLTRLVRWREANKGSFLREENIKLTYMPAISEAVAQALKAYPQVNVSVEGYNILYKKHIHLGIAVALDDGNLIVPVVHDADRLNVRGLALAINDLSDRARHGKLQTHDIEGGTFTITNFGSSRTLFGTPIINQPQAAILGVGYLQKKPVVVETPEGDTIAIRYMMYLSLSYDHRVVDGMLAGNFLRFIADYLENWNPPHNN